MVKIKTRFNQKNVNNNYISNKQIVGLSEIKEKNKQTTDNLQLSKIEIQYRNRDNGFLIENKKWDQINDESTDIMS